MGDRESGGEGAARRRRQRRLRQWARHEKLSVQTVLAGYQHHSSRGQRTARAGEVEEHGRTPAYGHRSLLHQGRGRPP